MKKNFYYFFFLCIFFQVRSISYNKAKDVFIYKNPKLNLNIYFKNEPKEREKKIITFIEKAYKKFYEFVFEKEKVKSFYKIAIGEKNFIASNLFLNKEKFLNLSFFRQLYWLNSSFIEDFLNIKPEFFLSSLLAYKSIKDPNSLINFSFIKKFFEENCPLKIHNFFLIKDPLSSDIFYEIFIEIAYFHYHILFLSQRSHLDLKNWSSELLQKIRIFFSSKSLPWYARAVDNYAYSSFYKYSLFLTYKKITQLFLPFTNLEKNFLEKDINKEEALLLQRKLLRISLKSPKKSLPFIQELEENLEKKQSFWSFLFSDKRLNDSYRKLIKFLEKEKLIESYLKKWDRVPSYSHINFDKSSWLKKELNKYELYLRDFEEKYLSILKEIKE